MAYFDQRGQTVTNQWNIVNEAVGKTMDRESLLAVLDEIVRSTKKEYGEENISDAEFKEAKDNLELAKVEAASPTPDKPKLTGYVEAAKKVLTDAAAVAGLYKALAKLVEKIPHLPF